MRECYKLFKEILNVDLKTPFTRLKYKEAMERFSVISRICFGMELQNITNVFEGSEFEHFQKGLGKDGVL